MPECPSCIGEGDHDFSDVDGPLRRLYRIFGYEYTPLGVVQCPTCEGTGVVSEAVARDYEAWATSRVDQFLAAVEAGEISIS